MDIRFQPNNLHLDSSEQFVKHDPHLKRLSAQTLIYQSDLIEQFPWQEPGIITLVGGRQIGKTTLLKQWMAYLLEKQIDPQAICFFSGELIDDYQALYTLVQAQIAQMPTAKLKYCIIDEVSYIKDWDRAVKYLADTGVLSDVVLMLSGSDSVLIQDARKRFPGRRGLADQVDFHYYPLSFGEYIQLKKILPSGAFDDCSSGNGFSIETLATKPEIIEVLFREFDRYLVHGGFLTAINDFEKNQFISPATLMVYSDWIRGDMLKRNKKEVYLREIIQAMFKHYTKQISWDNLVKELSIDHTQTIADYVSLLDSMDAVLVQQALKENTLGPAPKKRKKLIFCDPFIYHAMRLWLEPEKDPYQQQIQTIFKDPVLYSEMVEACVVSHFKRHYPTYYIKAEGEVDIAYVHKNKFYPIEIKWTSQLRPKDLKQISKYSHGKIYARTRQLSEINYLPVIPLPLALLGLDNLD